MCEQSPEPGALAITEVQKMQSECPMLQDARAPDTLTAGQARGSQTWVGSRKRTSLPYAYHGPPEGGVQAQAPLFTRHFHNLEGSFRSIPRRVG